MKGPWLGDIATLKEYRAHGGLIGFAPDPRTTHTCSLYAIGMFFANDWLSRSRCSRELVESLHGAPT